MELEILQQFGITGSSVAIVLIIYKLFKHFKGHVLISKCCGKKMEVGFDVKQMSVENLPKLVDGTTNISNSERKQTDRQTVEISPV